MAARLRNVQHRFVSPVSGLRGYLFVLFQRRRSGILSAERVSLRFQKNHQLDRLVETEMGKTVGSVTPEPTVLI